MDEENNQEPKEVEIEKAGVVAFGPEGLDLALTTTNADLTKWVLPKGHLEKEDTSLDGCALREAYEELGWSIKLLQDAPIAVIYRPLGEDDNGVSYTEKVTFFIGRLLARIKQGERPIQFLAPHLAIRLVEHKEHAEVIVSALKRLAVIEMMEGIKDPKEDA